MLLRGDSGHSSRAQWRHAYSLSNPDRSRQSHAHRLHRHPKPDANHHRNADRDGHTVRSALHNADVHQHPDNHAQRHANLDPGAPQPNGDRYRRPANLYFHCLARASQQHAHPANRYAHPPHGDSQLMASHIDPDLRDRLRQSLLQLAAVPGPPGFEAPIREILHKLWAPLADQISISKLGNLAARIDGTGSPPRPSLAIVAHMDAIAFIVRRIDHGFLHISGLGSVDPRVLLGQEVTVVGRQPLTGIVVRPPDACLPDGQRDRTAAVEHLLVDLGRDEDEVHHLVRVGDIVVFDEPVQALGDDLVIGPGLDNRACLAAITEALANLHQDRPAWDVWAVATTREERNTAGAATAGFELAPNIAVAVDTTFGRGPSDDDQGTFPLGGGLTSGLGPALHPAVHALLAAAADDSQVLLVDEILPRQTSTDADELQVAGAGIPTGLLGLPIRNMHTCVEMVHLDDLAATTQLLTTLARQLDDDTLAALETAFDDD